MERLYQKVLAPTKICSREDHFRRKNCEGNPWCLHGLGENKVGIWKNFEGVLEDLCGTSLSVRALSHPCGLKNCGATCYLSVIFQSLFHNLLWRNALLLVENVSSTSTSSSLASENDDVFNKMIAKLKFLFIEMENGILKCMNPTELIDCFGVDKLVQQDPQEFLALFFERFGNMDVGKLLVGKENQRLKCEECGALRHTSLPFNSIQLSVTKSKTVQDALHDYCASEVLSDPIVCSNCNNSTYMTKSLVLTEAPPILLIHLLRYEYDRKRCTKKKIQNEFDFSEEIEVCGEQYVLTSVIYHIGTSAHGGHYVCDCRYWKDNRWFHLDDDNSVEIPPPFSTVNALNDGEPKDTVDLTKDDKGTAKNNRKRKRVKPEEEEQDAPEITLTSSALNRKKDCYLLFYVRKSLIGDAVRVSEEIVQQNESLKSIMTQVVAGNESTEQEVARLKLVSERWLEKFEQRKSAYNEIQPILTPKSVHDDFVLVDAEKLKEWIIGTAKSFRQTNGTTCSLMSCPSTTIDIVGREIGDKRDDDVEIVESTIPSKKKAVSVKCVHGKISPKALSNYKVLSKEAYQKIAENLLLRDQYFDEKELFLCVEADRDDLICYECGSNREESSQQILSEQIRISDLLGEIQKDLDDIADGDKDAGVVHQGYWLSKKFLQELKKYSTKLTNEMVRYANSKEGNAPNKGNTTKKIEIVTVESLRASSFTQGLPFNGRIWCDKHNQLSLDVKDQAYIVTRTCMNTIEELFQPCIVCSTESDLCKECGHDREDKELTSNQQEISRQEQRNDQQLMELFKRKTTIPPELMDLQEKGKDFYLDQIQNCTSTFYLMNAQWMNQWRGFIRTGTKSVEKLSINSILCQHGNLFACDVLGLASGSIKQLVDKLTKEDQLAQVEVIRDNEFQKLSILYAEHHFNVKKRKCEEISNELDMVFPTVQQIKQEDEQSVFYHPDFCAQCLQDRWDLFKTNTQFFANTALTVLYFGSKDLMIDFQRKRDSGQKVVIRSRGSSMQKFTVSVSHDDTVGLTKLKIFESSHVVDLPPAQQMLFDELGIELDDNTKKLSDCGIHAESMIFVVKTGEQGGIWVDGFYECYGAGQQEEGFKGGIWNANSGNRKESNRGNRGSSSVSSSSSQVIEIDE